MQLSHWHSKSANNAIAMQYSSSSSTGNTTKDYLIFIIIISFKEDVGDNHLTFFGEDLTNEVLPVALNKCIMYQGAEMQVG